MDRLSLTYLTQMVYELATEIDLHYEEADYFALAKTIRRMKKAVDHLESQKVKVPKTVYKVIERFNRSFN